MIARTKTTTHAHTQQQLMMCGLGCGRAALVDDFARVGADTPNEYRMQQTCADFFNPSCGKYVCVCICVFVLVFLAAGYAAMRSSCARVV